MLHVAICVPFGGDSAICGDSFWLDWGFQIVLIDCRAIL